MHGDDTKDYVSKMSIRVGIVANCQARPLAAILDLLSSKFSIEHVVISHLAKDASEAANYEALSKVDIIFAQLVAPNYPFSHVRTNRLREAFGSRVIVWPNIFFRGQTPDIYYAGNNKIGRLQGPLGEYHSWIVLDSWDKRLTVSETVERFASDDVATERLIVAAHSSLSELESREQQCDVTVSDVIADRWRSKRLFFVFNHPALSLLLELGNRLMKFVGVKDLRSVPDYFLPEPLSNIIPTTVPGVAARLGLTYPNTTLAKGVVIDVSQGYVRAKNIALIYSIEEFVECSFRCYELQNVVLGECRLT